MRKEQRKEMILRRKNFLPSLLVIIVLWISLAGIVYFTSPSSLMITLFFLITFLAFLFTLSITLKNTRRGFVFASGATLFLLLRYFGVGNILNLILIAALVAVIEVYANFKRQS